MVGLESILGIAPNGAGLLSRRFSVSQPPPRVDPGPHLKEDKDESRLGPAERLSTPSSTPESVMHVHLVASPDGRLSATDGIAPSLALLIP